MTKKIAKLMLNWQEYKIREYQSGWWWRQPWANTILYVPMKDDLIDHSNNHLTLTNSWVSLASNEATIDVWYFNGSSDINWADNISFGSWDFHVWVWLKMTSTINSQFCFAWTARWNVFMWYQTIWWNKLWIGRNDVAWDSIFRQTLSTNTRYYVSFDRASSDFTISLNTSPLGTLTNGYSYDTSWWYKIWNDGNWNYINWYMSNFIIEDKAWSAQEITDYYNQTCADYWLSPI